MAATCQNCGHLLGYHRKIRREEVCWFEECVIKGCDCDCFIWDKMELDRENTRPNRFLKILSDKEIENE